MFDTFDLNFEEVTLNVSSAGRKDSTKWSWLSFKTFRKYGPDKKLLRTGGRTVGWRPFLQTNFLAGN